METVDPTQPFTAPGGDPDPAAEVYLAGHRLRLDLAFLLGRHLKATHTTQAALAGNAGMARSVLCNILQAKTNVTVETIGRLAVAAGVEVEIVIKTKEGRGV